MTGNAPRLWDGRTVAILAGGPSLRTQDISLLFRDAGIDQVKVIAVNDSWRLLPSFAIATSKPFKCGQCDGTGGTPDDFCTMCDGNGRISTCAMYFSDAPWWQCAMNSNLRLPDNSYSFHDAIYKGWWWTGSPGFDGHPQVNALRLTGQDGMEDDPSCLRHGSNSGYAAINLAVHLGAKRILLLGYDMRLENGRSNWHDELRPFASPSLYEQSMLPHFATLVEPLGKLGVEVVNCTPGSALDAFPKATLEDALCSPSGK